ncbi:MAG TPA: sulfite exporter TauE/SafE family protein [Chroococcales cyanobacterium]
MDLSTVSSSSILIFLTAAIFSSLGMGGSAGYLAVFSLLSVPAATMSTSVLLINVLVTSITVISFTRAGHKPVAALWPFLLTSIPSAFIGGSLHLQDQTYSVLLALALAAAAVGVAIVPHQQSQEPDTKVLQSMTSSRAVPLLAGCLLGLIAGIVGIGGGVLLSPILILLRWDTVRRIAATTATFSFVNSLAGLAGRCSTTSIDFTVVAPLVVAACAGAFLGSRLGSKTLSTSIPRRLLALVLTGVAARLMITSAGPEFDSLRLALTNVAHGQQIAERQNGDQSLPQ